jgi:hypothetical protein
MLKKEIAFTLEGSSRIYKYTKLNNPTKKDIIGFTQSIEVTSIRSIGNNQIKVEIPNTLYSKSLSINASQNTDVFVNSHNDDTHLLLSLNERGNVFVRGRLKKVTIINVDETSKVDLSEVNNEDLVLEIRNPITCNGEIHIRRIVKRMTTRQAFVKECISFPHSEMDCMAVTDDMDDEQVCKICYANTSNAQTMPCGHTFSCLRCAEKLRTQEGTSFLCPLCRTEIMSVNKLSFI